VPIECSFNYSNDPQKIYRAEVEFITKDEWLQELECLHSDLTEEDGQLSKEYSSPDSIAGTAYAKIAAVYPGLTAPLLARTEPRTLLDGEQVREVLGSVKHIHAQTAVSLFEQVQPFVDSVEKSHRNNTMAYWPLLKVVRLFTKAEALSTGAIIVDLVGSFFLFFETL